MEVILKEDVNKLGSRGDVVKVAEGYGRNYLLPRKLAIEATAGNKAVIDQMKSAAVRRSAKEKTQAEELAKQFDGVSVSFQRRSGEHDQLFGSVTSSDIGDALAKKGFNVDRRKIQLHEPLKSVGEFTVPLRLHKDVTTHLKVVIEKEVEHDGDTLRQEGANVQRERVLQASGALHKSGNVGDLARKQGTQEIILHKKNSIFSIGQISCESRLARRHLPTEKDQLR